MTQEVRKRAGASDARRSSRQPAVGGLSGVAGGAAGKLALPAYRLVIFIVAIAIWQLIASKKIISSFYISSPRAIVDQIGQWIGNGTLWPNAGATIEESMLGWVIGCAAGGLVGFALGTLRRVHRVLEPYISVLNAAPRLALAPMFVVWFGLGLVSKIALVVSVTFFVLLINMAAGTQSVDDDFLTLAKTMGASRLQKLRYIVVPSTVPWMFAGLRLALAYAFSAAVVSEFIAATKGLGYIIANAAGYLDITAQLAAIGVLLVVVFVIDIAMGNAERYILRYRRDARAS